MKVRNIIHGPIVQTHSGIVYSITLLSGHIVTSPEGFGIDIELTPKISDSDMDNIPRIEDYAPDTNQKEIHV